jgi:Mrp family chromosome partitioning ATPase
VQAAVERLAGAEVHFMGAVLNRVDLRRNAYYYARYYSAKYGEYYRAADGSRRRDGHEA